MNKIDSNMSAYLHAYEAYRIPKGTAVKDATGQEHVLSKEEDVLVLTEKSSKQLIEDRRDYGALLQMEAEVAAQKTQEEGMKKSMDDMAKALAVFRSMSDGDIVPDADERPQILEIHTRNMPIADDIDLLKMVRILTGLDVI